MGAPILDSAGPARLSALAGGRPAGEAWTGGVNMPQQPASPVKDKNYDLITVLHVQLRSVWKTEKYAEDAERDGDSELAGWFRAVQEKDRTAAGEGKLMLLRRLQEEVA
jgi:hypothetical protein